VHLALHREPLRAADTKLFLDIANLLGAVGETIDVNRFRFHIFRYRGRFLPALRCRHGSRDVDLSCVTGHMMLLHQDEGIKGFAENGNAIASIGAVACGITSTPSHGIRRSEAKVVHWRKQSERTAPGTAWIYLVPYGKGR
jgi:hypothetical protein